MAERRLDRFRRSPEAFVFALGLALLAGLAWFLRAAEPGREPAARPALIVSPAAVAHLREARRRESGARGASGAEERALLERAIDEEILFREASGLAAESGDPVVRGRLLALARELEIGATGEGEADVAEARRLGLDRTDAVVRRYLIEAMRLALARADAPVEPDEAELRAYLAKHGDRFAEPERLHLVHVFVAGDRDGEAGRSRADRVRTLLARGDADPRAAGSLGDPFARGFELRATVAELDRVFGPGFGRAVEAIPDGAWSDPIPSVYGLHLVRLLARTPARRPDLAAVRSRVVHALLEERGDRHLRARLAALRSGARVELPGATAPRAGVAPSGETGPRPGAAPSARTTPPAGAPPRVATAPIVATAPAAED